MASKLQIMEATETGESFSYFEHILSNPGLSHIMSDIYDSLDLNDIKNLRLVSKASNEMAERTKNYWVIKVRSLNRFLKEDRYSSYLLKDVIFMCAAGENKANLRLFDSFMLEYFQDEKLSGHHPIKKAVFDENLALMNLYFKIEKKVNGVFVFSDLFTLSLHFAIEFESHKVMKWLLSRFYVQNNPSRTLVKANELTKLSTADYFISVSNFLKYLQERGITFKFPISKLLNRPTRSPTLIQMKKQLKEQYGNLFGAED